MITVNTQDLEDQAEYILPLSIMSSAHTLAILLGTYLSSVPIEDRSDERYLAGVLGDIEYLRSMMFDIQDGSEEEGNNISEDFQEEVIIEE